jgi:peptidoglycan/LPS O-acetylase OafA/YrhL
MESRTNLEEHPACLESPRGVGTNTYYPWLDVLRGLSWIFVVIAHSGVPGFGFLGRVGVGIFFAISGWLITGILIRQKEQNLTSLSTFSTRRCLRILPLYYLLIILACVTSAYWFKLKMALAPEFASDKEHRLLKYLLTFSIEDCRGALGGLFVGHCWSICVEERFYLVLPLFVAFCPRNHYSRCALALLLCIAWVLVVARFPVDIHHYGTSRQTMALHLLPFPMLFGAGLAVFLARNKPVIPGFIALPGCLACLYGYMRFTSMNDATTFPMHSSFSLFPGLMAAGIVFCAVGVRATPEGFVAVLLQKLGKLSYAAYIIHVPFAVLGARYAAYTGYAWDGPVLAILLCTPAAYLLHRWVEEPILGTRTIVEKSAWLRWLCTTLQVVPLVVGLIFLCPLTMQKILAAGVLTLAGLLLCYYAGVYAAMRTRPLLRFAGWPAKAALNTHAPLDSGRGTDEEGQRTAAA